MAPPAPAAGLSLAKASTPVKLALAGGFVALIAFAYWFMFYSDVSKRIAAAKRQTTELRAERDRQLLAQQSYLADKEDLATRQQRAPEFNKVLPAEAQEWAVLSAIQTASNTAGVDLKGWNTQEEQIQAFYAKMPMKVEVTGKFHQITKFAHEIGKMDRIINLENIELVDPKQEGDEVVLRGRCLATAFHTLKVVKPGAPGQEGEKK
jgi:type IV pilus assembly protein PilO